MVLLPTKLNVAAAFNNFRTSKETILKAAASSIENIHGGNHGDGNFMFKLIDQFTHASTKWITFSGSLILAGAVCLAGLNIAIVLFNYWYFFFNLYIRPFLY